MDTVKKTVETTTEDWLLIGKVVGAHGLNGHVKVYAISDFPERFEVPGDRWLRKPGREPVQIKLTSGRYLEGKNQYLVKLAGVDDRNQAEDLRSAELLVKAGDRLPLDPGEFHVSDLIGLTVVMKEDQSTIGTVQDVFTMGHDMLEVVVAPELISRLTAESGTETPSDKTDTNKKIEASATESLSANLPAQKSEGASSIRAKAAQKLKRKARRQNKKKKPKTLLIPFVEEIVPTVDVASGRIEITPPPGLIEL